MIPARLLALDVVVIRAAQVADRYGQTTEDWATATRTTWPRAGAYEPTTGREVEDAGRDTETSTARLWLSPDVDVTGRDRLEVGGTVWRVDGPPLLRYSRTGPHHLELRLVAAKG